MFYEQEIITLSDWWSLLIKQDFPPPKVWMSGGGESDLVSGVKNFKWVST